MNSLLENRPYIHVGSANDLKGFDRVIYRSFEILPGLLSWGTLIGTVVLSYFNPTLAAFCVIAFDLYWLLKTIYLSIHLYRNWKRMKYNINLDWVKKLSSLKHDHIYHLILLPFYKEGKEIIEGSVKAIINNNYDKKKIILVLASEEAAGEEAQKIALEVKEKYGDTFFNFLITKHPKGQEGELQGKGSNISYASEQARLKVIDQNKIPYEDIIVSAMDIDTVPYPQYFSCLTWYFLTTPNSNRASFQPVPLYHNNVWQTPMLSKVVASSDTFWQMIEQERPERLVTFSSHSVSFKSLYEIGYWQKNIVSEDSRIFWNLYLANNGDYKVVPLSYPVSMDANLSTGFFETLKNMYKQHRRWMWGSENIPYILFNFLKDKKISFSKKTRHIFVQLEGFWSLATNPLIILFLGWFPLLLGGNKFNSTILSYNLPIVTRDLMILAMGGLIVLAAVSLSLMPKIPDDLNRNKTKFYLVVQWLLVPVTIVIFGSIPGLDAQTRLMFGKYMGYWVTPKSRSLNNK
ncbi:MAG: glycosyltransferase family 2 protein [Candidatus Paceibacterota bacterium]